MQCPRSSREPGQGAAGYYHSPELEPGGLGGQRDLGGIGVAGEQDQLVAASIGEAGHRVGDFLWRGEGTGGDALGEVASETVIVAEVAPGVCLSVIAEADVGEGGQAGLSGTAGLAPGPSRLVRTRGERLWAAASHDPPDAELGHAAEGRGGIAADQQWRAARLHRGRPDWPGVAAGLLCPDRPQLGELGVEGAAPSGERGSRRLVVVGSSADGDARLQPAAGDGVYRGELLG